MIKAKDTRRRKAALANVPIPKGDKKEGLVLPRVQLNQGQMKEKIFDNAEQLKANKNRVPRTTPMIYKPDSALMCKGASSLLQFCS